LTHLLIDSVKKPGYDEHEHTTNPDPNNPKYGLMFKDSTFENRMFLTVTFFEVVLREIAASTNTTFGR
jgi:hypothetical protein